MTRHRIGSALLSLAFVAAGCESPEEKLPDDFRPEDVSAVDADTFWVLGRAEKTTLLHTTDGGSSFSVLSDAPNLPLDPEMLVHPETVTDVVFADADNGWIYGGTLWSTHDGGESWTRLDAEDEHVGWLTATDEQVYAVAQEKGKSYLWRAPVDSDDWERLELTFGGPNAKSFVAVEDVLAMIGGESSMRGAILVSTDGGDSFEQRDTDCLPRYWPGSLTAVTADQLWLTCPTDLEKPWLWHVMLSTDQGRSWERVYAHDTRGRAGWPKVTARDDGAAVVVAPRAGLVRLGVGVEPESIDVPGYDLNEHLVFATPDDGIAFASRGGRLLRTTDGGRSWDPVEFTG